jgi:hypothetical protein
MKIFLLGLLLVAVFGSAGQALHQEQCQPSFLMISEESVSVLEKGTTFDAKCALIGCEQNLATLTSDELKELNGLLGDFLREKHFSLVFLAREERLRRAFAKRANQVVGREVATDVLLFDVSFSESMDP